METCSGGPNASVIVNPRPNLSSVLLQFMVGSFHALKKGATTLPLLSVHPRLDGVDHDRGECDLLIEGVLANALVELHRKMNRCLAEALAVLRANAWLCLGAPAA